MNLIMNILNFPTQTLMDFTMYYEYIVLWHIDYYGDVFTILCRILQCVQTFVLTILSIAISQDFNCML